MMISVSTYFCSSSIPESATRMRWTPSNWNGLVTTPTVRMPDSRAMRAMTGAAPVPVPPPMPAVMNTMFEPCIDSSRSSTASSAAARPTSGRAPAPRPWVTPIPSWILRGAVDSCSACASVLQTMNSQPTRFERIMLLTAFPPAPPTPTTVMRGLSSCSSVGMLRLIMLIVLHACATVAWSGPARPVPPRPDRRQPAREKPGFGLRPPDVAARYYLFCRKPGTRDQRKIQANSKILAQPLPDPAEHPVGRAARRARRFGTLGHGKKEEPRRGRKRRAVGRFGEALDAGRPADPDLLVENEAGQFAHPMQLTGAAGQHDTPSGDLVAAARFQPLLNELECFLDARGDDADEQRFGHMVDMAVFVFADLRNGDHFALVEGRGDGAAKQRLHPLGVGKRGRQAAGDVVGDMEAADPHRIGEDQTAAEKHADRRRAAAHVDNRDAEIHLIIDEAGEAGGVGAHDQRLDFEMRAPDRRGVVAHARRGGGDDMHVDAEPLADHAARVEDAAAVVDRKADRDRMNHLPVGCFPGPVAALEDLAHVAIGDLVAPHADFRLDDARGGIAARQVGDGAPYRFTGHLLGGVYGIADRIGGGIEIDDRSALHAARDLMADAEDARLVFDPRDEAADLGRADVDRRDHAAARTCSGRTRARPVAVAGGAVPGDARGVDLRRGALLRSAFLHVLFPDARAFFAGAVSPGAAPAGRSTSGSGSRISTLRISRCSSLFARSCAASRAQASARLVSGSRTSIALSICRFQRRSS